MPAEGPAAGAGRRAVFVYYKVAAGKAQLLRQAVALLDAMPAPWGLELMRRADSAGPGEDSQTWMEVYTLDGDEQTRDPQALVQLIEARARQAGILDLVEGERHYEVFDSCA